MQTFVFQFQIVSCFISKSHVYVAYSAQPVKFIWRTTLWRHNVVVFCQKSKNFKITNSYINGILPKESYLPSLCIADRALLAGYPRYWALPMKLFWGATEPHSVQFNISSGNVSVLSSSYLCHHLPSLGHNVLKSELCSTFDSVVLYVALYCIWPSVNGIGSYWGLTTTIVRICAIGGMKLWNDTVNVAMYLSLWLTLCEYTNCEEAYELWV